jgi:hypothetical protein
MGRQVRRVPLDFSWPLEKVYDGFLNPFVDKIVQNASSVIRKKPRR